MPDKDNQDFRAKILMVIPLYNHGRTVRTVVTRALDAGWPVLVVDDGSTDGGLQTIADLPCETHRLVPNQGKGVAIQAAAKIAAESGYNAIIAVDADNQHDPSEAVLLADAAQEMPAIVIGARRMVQDTVPRASLFGRAFSNFWVRLECGQDLPDTQSGFRLYPVQELLDLKIRSKRYAFEVEVLARAAWAGIPIRSVPVSVHYPPREERASHFHQIKDNFRLTVLHTNLVLRALNPWPHKRLMECPRESVELSKPGVSIFHPVKLLKRICLEHSSAFQLAVAVWMGIFLGALPLIAIHTVVIVYVTHRLHLNKVAAIAASQVCMPPVVPVICIQAGYFMRNGHLLLDVNWDTTIVEMHQRLWEWFLGSLIVGPLLGLLFGVIAYFGVVKLRAGKSADWEASESE